MCNFTQAKNIFFKVASHLKAVIKPSSGIIEAIKLKLNQTVCLERNSATHSVGGTSRRLVKFHLMNTYYKIKLQFTVDFSVMEFELVLPLLTVYSLPGDEMERLTRCGWLYARYKNYQLVNSFSTIIISCSFKWINTKYTVCL